MTLHLLENLRMHARNRADAGAIRAAGGIAPQQDVSYSQLAQQISRLASALRKRLPGNSVVLLCYPNRVEYIRAFLAVLDAGFTLFAVSSDSAGPEIARAARRAGAAAAIVLAGALPADEELFQQCHPLPELSENARLLVAPRHPAAQGEGPALLLHSSGTTAEPKIVRRDGKSLDAVARNTVRACGFRADDQVLAAVPLCHSYGLEHGLLAPIAAGSCIHVCEKFDLPVVLSELRDGGITLLPGVPFMFEMLCHAPRTPFPSLRRAYSAGGPLPLATGQTFQRKFGLRLGQVFGATEIGSVTFNNPDAVGFDPAGVGVAMEGVSIQVLDIDHPRIDRALPPGVEGQLAIAAPSMLSGYLNDEAAPIIGGHFLTDDLGILAPSGALTLTGRLKLLIDVGGRKVNPAEVEAVLRQHPGIGQCIVAPMRVSDTVCRLRAIVTPIRPDVELSPQDLRRFARERLSAYKVPRVIEIRDTLPTSPAGKVVRRLVETS